MIPRSLRRLAVVGAVALAAVSLAAPAQAADLSLDVQLPGSFGESARPTPFEAVVHNPGAAQANARLTFTLGRDHDVPADHFDVTFRHPQTGTWQPVILEDDPDRGTIVGRTSEFKLAAGSDVTLRLTFAYHPGPFDASLLDPNEVTFNTTLVAAGADGDSTLASDWDNAPIERMAVYFSKLPKQIKGGGAPATFEIRYTNASESSYQPVRPFLFIEGYGSGLTAANTVLEWQKPGTTTWTAVPIVDDANGQIASFTADHAVLVPAQSTASVKLRITASAAVTGGRTLFRAGAYVDADRGFGLNHNQTYTTVVKPTTR